MSDNVDQPKARAARDLQDLTPDIQDPAELSEAAAEAVRGGEIKDFSFGIENPTTIGSATGGAGAGKIKFNEF